MFDRLLTSLNIAFKWFPMFDLDQTFTSNIVLLQLKQAQAGKSNQSETEFMRRRAIISAVIRYVGSL